MDNRDRSIEDDFLDAVVKAETEVTILLTVDVRVCGVITGYDEVCLILKRNDYSQMIYMSAIAVIQLCQPTGILRSNG